MATHLSTQQLLARKAELEGAKNLLDLEESVAVLEQAVAEREQARELAAAERLLAQHGRQVSPGREPASPIKRMNSFQEPNPLLLGSPVSRSPMSTSPMIETPFKTPTRPFSLAAAERLLAQHGRQVSPGREPASLLSSELTYPPYGMPVTPLPFHGMAPIHMMTPLQQASLLSDKMTNPLHGMPVTPLPFHGMPATPLPFHGMPVTPLRQLIASQPCRFGTDETVRELASQVYAQALTALTSPMLSEEEKHMLRDEMYYLSAAIAPASMEKLKAEFPDLCAKVEGRLR